MRRRQPNARRLHWVRRRARSWGVPSPTATPLRRASPTVRRVPRGSQRGAERGHAGPTRPASSLRKRAENAAILAHESTAKIELLLNLGIVGREQISGRSFDGKERVVLFCPQPNQHFFRQHEAGGCAYGPKLEFHMVPQISIYIIIRVGGQSMVKVSSFAWLDRRRRTSLH